MSIILKTPSNGSVTLAEQDTASDVVVTVPAVTATLLNNSSGVMNIGSGQVVKDAAGNLGLGVTPSAWAAGSKGMEFAAAGNAVWSNGTSLMHVLSNSYFNGTNYIYGATAPAAHYYQFNGTHVWRNAPSGTAGNAISFTPAMTLTAAGELLVGTTAGNNPVGDRVNGFSILSTGRAACRSSVGWDWGVSGSSGTHVQFYTDNGSTYNGAGTISSNGATTSFNTSSDYRLKENIQPMQNALATVAALKPVTYNWKADGSDGQGFIAHELQAVVPDCVTGEKDAMRTEKYEVSPAIPATFDEDGNELTPAFPAVMGEREVPQYQGIDVSFLVATLTAAIQEQQAALTQLQADVAALQGAA